ncbi:hypothetical protein L1987_48536 [Smallanthus sonchifolius]|uniref:Uncharacterized protein n=1 Tax=Smallanthus sonchifolius TaxID=185202 RepID=A0ACB9FT43_9ASTR|nr:hypothetical protein L1987_48536 [Smallanthus sonchifolius]
MTIHQDNSIEFWRKIVAEYFAHNAKKKWCIVWKWTPYYWSFPSGASSVSGFFALQFAPRPATGHGPTICLCLYVFRNFNL